MQRFRAGVTRAVAVLGLGVCSIAVAGQDAAAGESDIGGPGGAGWYVSLAAGANASSDLKQAGRNRDDTCYPDDDCRHLAGGRPTGYRWFYDLHAASGTAVELAVGRFFGDTRIEVGLTQRRSAVAQAFAGITYLDGSPLVPATDSAYESMSNASTDDLTVRSLSVNVYRDFPLAYGITPYLGAGLGMSSAELSGIHYEGRYRCRPAVSCDNPGQYDGLQHIDLSDIVPSGHVHAGVDVDLGSGILIGLKLSYNRVSDIDGSHGYSEHKVPGLTSFTRISEIDRWSLLVGAKYLLDGR